MKVLSISICAIALSACSHYQYSSVTSERPPDQNGEFVFENDSLILSYNFSGIDCPIKVSVQNKTKAPLYIDWRKSSVIINGVSTSYWQDKANFNGEVHGINFNWTSWETTASNISGEMSKPEAVTFVPPNAKVATIVGKIQPEFGDFKKDPKNKILLASNDGGEPAWRRLYAREESPLQFRSYVTVSTDQNFATSTAYDHEFWVSQIVYTPMHPKDYQKHMPGNMYYTTKVTGGGAFLVLATTGLIAVTAFAEDQ